MKINRIETMTEEQRAYFDAGQQYALRELMMDSVLPQSKKMLVRKFKAAIKTLESVPKISNTGVPGNPENAEIWDGSLCFTSTDLLNFVKLLISDLRLRLEKSRQVYAVQEGIINNLRQESLF